MIRAGEMDQRIALLAATLAQGGPGEAVETWTLMRSVWARAMEGAGREFVASGQVAPQGRVAFKIRWASDIAVVGARLRAGWSGGLYEVVNATGSLHGGEMWLHCQKIGVYP